MWLWSLSLPLCAQSMRAVMGIGKCPCTVTNCTLCGVVVWVTLYKF